MRAGAQPPVLCQSSFPLFGLSCEPHSDLVGFCLGVHGLQTCGDRAIFAKQHGLRGRKTSVW